MTDNLSWVPLQDNTTGHEYVLRDEQHKRLEESNRKPFMMYGVPSSSTVTFPIGLLTPESLDAIRQIVREETRGTTQPCPPPGGEQSSRINRLEHLLKSFVDFVERPTIAGDTLMDMQNYALALCKTAHCVLEEE